MIFDNIKNKYGDKMAEMLRQSLSAHDFERLSFEELSGYFEAEAEECHSKFIKCLNNPPALNWPGEDLNEYLNSLRCRWKHSEELVRVTREAA